MQRTRAAIVLLTIFLTALTAIGMEMMPVSTPPAGNHANTAMHEGHHGDAQPGDDDRHDGPNNCSYCQLAKATDLPSLHGPAPIHRRLLTSTLSVQTGSCHLRAWRTSCRPRAPPASIV